ncbi:polysaccharide biosynthesis/export family protein [uncultured Cohaesibacter sp.]|uniref:polysaccharide biosynthesis/export family protein n=1 Tax=uncultured Cohaesibacter sp. TaxID=1002546 RepID=UPI00292EAB5D|nr:polysaccharide biosynthesis/export family protein [uncultured Cohaesibacter sp.]
MSISVRFRSAIAFLAALCLALVILGGQAVEATPSLPVTMQDFPVMVGDELEITFLDHSADTTQTMLYKRNDLSGKYTVSGSGMINLPILGNFNVLEKSLGTIADQLEDESLKLNDIKLVVRVGYASRPPVFIKGDVNKPGAYRYIPNMTVSQLLALASGYLKVGRDVSSKLPIMEAEQNVDAAKLRLASLLSRKARLQAAIDEKDTIDMPSELVELLGASKAQDLFQKQIGVYKQSFDLWKRRVALDKAKIDLAAAQVRTVRELIKNVSEEEAAAVEAYNDWNKKYLPKYFDVSREAAEGRRRDKQALIETRRKAKEATANFYATQSNLAEAQRLANEHDLTYFSSLAGDLVETEQNILDAQMSLETAKSRVALLQKENEVGLQASNTGKKSGKDGILSIQRRQGRELVVLPAEEVTQIKPGDIIEVSLL